MTKPLRQIVGDNIRKYREEQGLNRRQLDLKVGNTTASKVRSTEEGKTGMTLATLEKFATALNVKVIDLVEDWSEGE